MQGQAPMLYSCDCTRHLGRCWPHGICNDVPLGNRLLAAKGSSNSIYREKPPRNTCCLQCVERHTLERGGLRSKGLCTKNSPKFFQTSNMIFPLRIFLLDP